MNTIRRGSISIPVLPQGLTELKALHEDKQVGITTLTKKLEELEAKLNELEKRKVVKCACKCDQVESRVNKDLKQIQKQIKELIES